MADQQIPPEETTPREIELEERIKRDQFDAEAWEGLIELAESSKNVDKLRTVLNRVLEKFPFAHAVWIKLMELEESLGNNVRSFVGKVNSL